MIDFNVALHDRIRAVGAHVEYGDLSNPDTLHHAGVDRAEVVVSTVPDDLMRGIDNRRLVATVRKLNAKAIIIANAVNYRRRRRDLRRRRRLRVPVAHRDRAGAKRGDRRGPQRRPGRLPLLASEERHGPPGTRDEVLMSSVSVGCLLEVAF